MKASQKNTLLVCGASGKLGRKVVENLLEGGATRVIAATRTPEKIADLKERGVEVRRADFDDPATLQVAFAGVDRLLIISTDAMHDGSRRLQQHRAAVDAAVHAGVKHVVYTSYVQLGAIKPTSALMDHYGTEQALAESGLGYTALRYNRYMERLQQRLPVLLEEGKLVGLVSEGGTAFISRDDCARAAAAVLLSDQPPRGIVNVSGSEAITNKELMQLLSEMTGREMPYVELSEAALTEHLLANGASAEHARISVFVETATAKGYYGVVTNAFEDLTGRPPIRLRDFLKTCVAEAATS